MVVLANLEEDISIIEVDVECSTRSRPQGVLVQVESGDEEVAHVAEYGEEITA